MPAAAELNGSTTVIQRLVEVFFIVGKTGSQCPTEVALGVGQGRCFRPGCKLAILTACETNLGPRSRSTALLVCRGLLVAAARRAVANNWIADDESSASSENVFCFVLVKRHNAMLQVFPLGHQ